MVDRIYLLFEILSILLFLWVLHGSKKKPGIVTIIYVCMELIITSMIAEGWISFNYVLFAYIGIVVVSIFEFDDTLMKAISYAVLDCIILFILQVLGALVYSLIIHSNRMNILLNVIVNMSLFCIMIYIFYRWNLQVYIMTFLNMNSFMKDLIIVSGIVLFILLKHESMQITTDWDMVVFLLVFSLIVIVVSVKLVKERIQKDKFIEQLQQYEQYNAVYKELITDIRHKQHDFNNHLQALYSMSLSCNTIEDLRNEQKQYFEKLVADNNAYSLLKENVSSVLTAFMYIKFKEIEKKGILIDYQIHINQLEKSISFPDIVELVGNLLDNAVDATRKTLNKRISFVIEERKDCVNFVMSNPYDWVEGEDFGRYMVDGKSSKGSMRGLGLSNVNKVIERYKGLMQVHFDYDNETKIIRFEIVLPIKKEER